MHPKKVARGQLRLASICSSMENLQSPLHRVTPILIWRTSVLPDDEIHTERDHKKEENTANMQDELNNVLGDNLSVPEPTTQSKILSMRKIIEEQWDMRNNAIQQNTQQWVQNAEPMEANREYCRESNWPEAMKTKIFNMTHPEQHCSRAKELYNFLDTLRANCHSHEHLLLHGDPDTVQYAATLLSKWNNNADPAQRQTQMTDLVQRYRDTRRDSDPGLIFEAFLEQMQKMYGNKDRKLHTAMKYYDRHCPRRACTCESLCQSNQSKLESSGMAPTS